MNFGSLDRQVDLEQYTRTRTASGSYTETWAKISTLWAKVDWKGGGEKIEASQEQGYNIVAFTIRYCSGLSVNEKQRIKYNNEYFDIEYVNELERKKYYQLMTRRKTAWREK